MTDKKDQSKPKKVRAKPTKFIAPDSFIEGVVSLKSVVVKERKTKIDYKGIKTILETPLENNETPVYFTKKSPAGMSALKHELETKFPELKLQLVKIESGQVGIALAPKAKA